MSGQYGHNGLARLTAWEDIGYQCRIALSAGRVHIRLWPCGQEWSPWSSVQAWALPGRAPEFYPPLSGPADSPVRQAVRWSLEAVEELRGGGAGASLLPCGAGPAPHR